MSTVYFIEETIYGNSFTDSEIIFASGSYLASKKWSLHETYKQENRTR